MLPFSENRLKSAAPSIREIEKLIELKTRILYSRINFQNQAVSQYVSYTHGIDSIQNCTSNEIGTYPERLRTRKTTQIENSH